GGDARARPRPALALPRPQGRRQRRLTVSIPGPTNATCDIYRAGNAPPAPPDVAAVPCRFDPDYRRGLEKGEGDTTGKFSAVMIVSLGTDVRDDYSGGTYGPN